MKSISIIYVYYNTPSELSDSIASLANEAERFNAEIIVVDNNSHKKIPKEVINNERVILIRNKKNKGFGKALNQASKIAAGKYLLFLNPDTRVSYDFLEKIILKMEIDHKIGLLGVRYTDGNGNHIKSVSGIPTFIRVIFAFSFLKNLFPKNKFLKELWMKNFNYNREQIVPVVGGACMIVRKNIFRKINGFDEQFFMYFEEADLSKRIKKAGYKVLYFPKITITHLIGRSSTDKERIKKIFENSRYKFIKKYEGAPKAILAEIFIRGFTSTNMLLYLIYSVSLFLNLYKITSLMMFYGDFGRDFLAARDMILTGSIPLRGIPSSVVWLHQGPLSIYLIGLSFLISKFNPVAPAILYGALGSISVFLTYLVGKEYFNQKIGLIAALIYATSPLIILNARMPYHTAPIPFFALIYFLILAKILKGKINFLPILAFIGGLLFLLELSNSVLFIVGLVSLFFYKVKQSKNEVIKSLLFFILGISPFVIYDINNHFVQTGGFVLWVLNRVRLFFGIDTSSSTSSHLTDAVGILWGEINRLVFPHSQLVVLSLFSLVILFTIINYKNYLLKKNITLVIYFWFLIPLLSFLIHAKPGVAYTPVLFPVITILLASMYYNLIKLNKFFLLPLLIISLLNISTVISNNYFLTTSYTTKRPELFKYSYGLDLTQREEVANVIVKNSDRREFSISGGGYLSKITTGIDNYKYLIWYKGGKISELGSIQYRIYEEKSEVKKRNKIIFENKYVAVTRNE